VDGRGLVNAFNSIIADTDLAATKCATVIAGVWSLGSLPLPKTILAHTFRHRRNSNGPFTVAFSPIYHEMWRINPETAVVRLLAGEPFFRASTCACVVHVKQDKALM